METTFITIHDLTQEARILYASDSVVDILGHTPDEVVNKSCWDFFHPDEVQRAISFHAEGIRLDKAAVLAYCQIRNRQGYYVTCECCFSICYDVMVCCTSIYRRGMLSHQRAVEAPIVRRMFTSSPQDPRYHMLTHLSSKFNQDIRRDEHEPRAALFLNRFTRTLTIMYATSGVEKIIGLSGEEMKGKSFYYCIMEHCLEDAVKCLETAKGNDSIAYLRFWFRDPRQDEQFQRDDSPTDTDVTMTDVTTSEDESDGNDESGGNESSRDTSEQRNHSRSNGNSTGTSHSTSGESSVQNGNEHNGSSASVTSPSSVGDPEHPIELEAVVSCTSDGLVVCLRRARHVIPTPVQPPLKATTQHAAAAAYGPGVYAAPWAVDPIVPAPYPTAPYIPAAAVPQQIRDENNLPTGPSVAEQHPAQANFLKAICDVGVFAWALTGINGSLVEYSRGRPRGECQPPDGLPVWTPDRADTTDSGLGSRQAQTPASGSLTSASIPEMRNGNGNGNSRDPFGDPGLSGPSPSPSSAINGHGRPWAV